VSGSIPFLRDFDFEYGRVDRPAPGLRRIVAPNPSRFTYVGTGTYILGEGRVAVIDPGPDDDSHLEALLSALRGETVTHILVTHTHPDHSPLSRRLAEATGAPTYAHGPHPRPDEEPGDEADDHLEFPFPVDEESGTDPDAEATAGEHRQGHDLDFSPDVTVGHGDVIDGEGWSVECLHTPGHISNHLCFAWLETNSLFSGDHVMGWSTSVISPPDGHMGDYLRSLELVMARGYSTLYPTHGPPIPDPAPFLEAFVRHRRHREEQILASLDRGNCRIEDIVMELYADVDHRLYRAAGRSVYAHLLGLVSDGTVEASDSPPRQRSEYRRRT